jgi:Fe-S cluster assembly protein SufD
MPREEPMNAPMTPLRTEAENALVAAFGAARRELAGGAAVAQRRDEALATFLRSGLPHRRVEAWHYTDLRAALREVLALAEAPSAATIEAVRLSLDAGAPRISGAEAIRLVLIDGVYVPDLSDSTKIPAGVVVRTLADALAQRHPPSLEALPEGALGSDDAALALNAAFMNGGLVIDVAEGTRVERPLELVSIAGEARPQSFFARSLVRLGCGAALTLIETHAAEGGTAVQKNDALVFDLAERAEIDHVATFSSTAVDSIHVSTLVARLGERARLTSFALVTGAGLLRRQGFLRFEGVHAKAALAGVSLLRGRQHADTTLVVHHVAPHCESREFFRHILDGEATGVFQGKVVVAPGAQKTDGVMKSQAILLSEDATMNNKPELEIFADDVVCGHGATCGELDADQVFYVQSRGLPRPEAEALLLEAFAAAAIDRVDSVPLHDMLLDRIGAWLAERSF